MSLQDSLGLPKLNTKDDLVRSLGFPVEIVDELLSNPDYRTVRLPKSSGGLRTIDIPSNRLKAVQAWILRSILDHISVDPAATAFRPGYSLLNNVGPHLYQPFVHSLDITDFFGHIRRQVVTKLFCSLGYSDDLSKSLSSLCCYRGRLPQGAVTSPAISNLVCSRMDRDIREYAAKYNVVYTRYADDITLSARSPDALNPCDEFVRSVLAREGFKIHPTKDKKMYPGDRHLITGLVINDNNEITIGREQYRTLRSAINRLAHGKELEGFNFGKASIRGWLNYLRDVDPKSASRLEVYWEQKLGSKPNIGARETSNRPTT